MIDKKIINPGKEKIQFEDGMKIRFHIKVQKPDQDEIIDDSRLWTAPMELLLGKKFKLEVLEASVRTMLVGETSEFIFNAQLVRSYPFVAKTLRDYHGKKQGKAVQARSHHCCAGGMEQGLGYKDLDELMSTPQDLKFTIELLDVDNVGSYEKEAWAMSPEEQKDSTIILKEKGNALFIDGKYDEASKKYSEAIGRLENLMSREKPGDDDWAALNENKMLLLLNYAQCQLSLGEYYSVIEHCTSVLQYKPDNTKALFRRGKAHAILLNGVEAREDLSKVKELDPAISSACQKILNELAAQEKKKMESDLTTYSKLFV